MKVGFNKPYISGKEIDYISDAIKKGKISGDGHYTKLCHQFFQDTYAFKKVLLTTSCTDALEMAALLLDIKEGDEIIIPSFTFVSSANPFILRGAKIVFADSLSVHPNIDAASIRHLINSKTKAIVVVHYGGIACDMDSIMSLADEFNLFVVEDAAQAIDSFYKGRPLGGIGNLGCISFHETKNIICGEGGMLIINDERFFKRAEIIWEKGTNRSAFFRGEIDKYGWVDVGSSFLLSDLNAAFLYAQLENLHAIQQKRKEIWDFYNSHLQNIEGIQVPQTFNYATNNAHMYYLLCDNSSLRIEFQKFLESKNIQAITHYTPLHASSFFKEKHDGRDLNNAIRYSECLLRIPFYNELTKRQQLYIISMIKLFFSSELILAESKIRKIHQ